MPLGRPKADPVLSKDERSQLTSIARSRSISAALVTRARIVLAAAAGERRCRHAGPAYRSPDVAGHLQTCLSPLCSSGRARQRYPAGQ